MSLIGDIGQGFEDFATGVGDLFTGGAEAVGNAIGGLGQSDFVSDPAMPNALNFVNPSAGNYGVGSQNIPPPGTPSLRDTLLPQVTAPNSAAPQAAAVTAQPVAPAQGSTFNLGLLSPGAAVAQGGVGTTGYGLAQAEGTRELQRRNLGGLYNAAAGEVPSAAEAQMRSGLASALRGNLALAASARGTGASRVAAQRAAADANAAASANVLGQSAALRAQEQAVARQQLTGALEGIRTGDFQTAQTGLGLLSGGTGLAGVGAQVGAAQLGSDTQTQLANLQSRTGIALGQLDADQATSLANLDATLKSRGMDDAQRIAYLSAVLQIDARTQEGAMALQQLITEAQLKADAINAQVSLANAGVAPQIVGATLGAAGEVGAASLGG